jgi:hypothetical protein
VHRHSFKADRLGDLGSHLILIHFQQLGWLHVCQRPCKRQRPKKHERQQEQHQYHYHYYN